MNFSLQDLIQILLLLKQIPDPGKDLKEGIAHLEVQVSKNLKSLVTATKPSVIQ